MINSTLLFKRKSPVLIFYTEDATLLSADFAHLFTCKRSVLVNGFDSITDKLIRKCRKCLYLTAKEPCQLFFVEHTVIFNLLCNNDIRRIPIPDDYYNLIPTDCQDLDKPKLQQEIC
jgi:hypothetical protein